MSEGHQRTEQNGIKYTNLSRQFINKTTFDNVYLTLNLCFQKNFIFHSISTRPEVQGPKLAIIYSHSPNKIRPTKTDEIFA